MRKCIILFEMQGWELDTQSKEEMGDAFSLTWNVAERSKRDSMQRFVKINNDRTIPQRYRHVGSNVKIPPSRHCHGECCTQP